MPGGWQGSTRRATLPPDWPRIRAAVLTRDNHRCQLDPTCTEQATDVDHIGNPHDHTPGNLRAACTWHHNRRSSAQGNANQRRPTTKRPREPHPGLLPPPPPPTDPAPF